MAKIASVALDHDGHDTHLPVQSLHATILQLIAQVHVQVGIVGDALHTYNAGFDRCASAEPTVAIL